MIDFQFTVQDRPGELAALTGRLKELGLSLRGLWGLGLGGGRGEIICVPDDPEAFRKFVREAELEAVERTVIFVAGEDRLGAVLDVLDQLGEANINLHSLDAIRLDGQYGAYIGVNASDIDAVEVALRRLLDF